MITPYGGLNSFRSDASGKWRYIWEFIGKLAPCRRADV